MNAWSQSPWLAELGESLCNATLETWRPPRRPRGVPVRRWQRAVRAARSLLRPALRWNRYTPLQVAIQEAVGRSAAWRRMEAQIDAYFAKKWEKMKQERVA